VAPARAPAAAAAAAAVSIGRLLQQALQPGRAQPGAHLTTSTTTTNSINGSRGGDGAGVSPAPAQLSWLWQWGAWGGACLAPCSGRRSTQLSSSGDGSMHRWLCIDAGIRSSNMVVAS
jgi:hypothetical protein